MSENGSVSGHTSAGDRIAASGHLRSFVCRNLDVRFLFSLPTFAASTVNDAFWLGAEEIRASDFRPVPRGERT